MGVRGSRLWAVALALVVVACGANPAGPALPEGATPSELGLTVEQVASLESLRQVDDYPLYTMHHYAPEPLAADGPAPSSLLAISGTADRPQWGCSLFAAVAGPESRIFGRNFDWEFSPALLLFNRPPDGYASVSMVDIAYLGFAGEASTGLTREPLAGLIGLLNAHRLPFDGMNEAGLVVGMAAVPETSISPDPAKETVDSLGIIRLMLDRAATVEQAVDVMQDFNVDFEGQVPLHYLLADASGDAALVEYHAGQMRVLRTETGWHHATNFLVSAAVTAGGRCHRYDTITAELESRAGYLDFGGAFALLERVAQPTTQWSVVYDLTSGEFQVAMGRDYERIHVLSLGS
jgi:hypothetical protein